MSVGIAYRMSFSIYMFAVPKGGITVSLINTVLPSFNPGIRLRKIRTAYLSGQSCRMARMK